MLSSWLPCPCLSPSAFLWFIKYFPYFLALQDVPVSPVFTGPALETSMSLRYSVSLLEMWFLLSWVNNSYLYRLINFFIYICNCFLVQDINRFHHSRVLSNSFSITNTQFLLLSPYLVLLVLKFHLNGIIWFVLFCFRLLNMMFLIFIYIIVYISSLILR